MKGNEIRAKFLAFFEGKGHTVVPSFSLVPEDDPSLLLIGAGMAPLKPYFTGAKTPPNRRMASCQKCVRTGDIEQVGKTARHHTFFEMLGNFSFGDYFKREAIGWAWEFLLAELKIDPEKLWVSVFQEDQQAWAIWHRDIGVRPERIVRLGRKDNFWEIGTGPCGPCSEIYYDMGPELGCGRHDCKPGCDCDRYLEIWNLVFTQFDKDEEGNYHPLSQPNIDTGMGLERVAAVLQGVTTNYDCDLIYPLIQHYANLAGVDYSDKRYTSSLRVLADHFRAVAFMLADGILPANEGRGYVLRRLLRRAVRHGMLCGIQESFLHTATATLVAMFAQAYPEVEANCQHIASTVKAEEERFLATVHQGSELLQRELAKLAGGGLLSGATAFRLYDTFGFPLELTVEIAAEKGVRVDEDGFRKALEVQRRQARAARGHVDAMGAGATARLVQDLPQTQFTGYTNLSGCGKVLALIRDGQRVEKVVAGEEVLVVLDQTPFYAEGGGQVGDTGTILGQQGVLAVKDVSASDGVTIHHCRVEQGQVAEGDGVTAEVSARRRDIQANHTATHLLHKVLRQVLGDHVRQAGSLVEAERLRFDYTHPSPMTEQQLTAIEERVNALIAADLPVEAREMPLAEARRLGAVALFGEKYGEQVRVVSVGDVSCELCGGTHVASTARVRGFKILTETGIGAGVRRIEAVTADGLMRHFFRQQQLLDQVCATAKSRPDTLVQRIEELHREIREQKAELEKLRAKVFNLEAASLVSGAREIAGVKVLATRVNTGDMAALRNQAETLLAQLGTAIVVVGAVTDSGKVNLVAAVSKDLVGRGVHAGKLVGAAAKMVGGGGGGRPDMAQAGGKEPGRLAEALEKAVELAAQQLAAR